ncbi:amino acid permease C-terminal domain-containing protein, partial [Heyndrickxia coagulans]
LIASLQPATLIRFVVWFAIGMVIYFGYSIRHSELQQEAKKTA